MFIDLIQGEDLYFTNVATEDKTKHRIKKCIKLHPSSQRFMLKCSLVRVDSGCAISGYT